MNSLLALLCICKQWQEHKFQISRKLCFYLPFHRDFMMHLWYNDCKVVGLGLQSRGSRVAWS